MKFYLERAIFVNRAPFDRLDLTFEENSISVITSVNGRGKTTILSHIADAFYEIAREYFPLAFEDRPNKLYRLSSAMFCLTPARPSFFYLRFRTVDGTIDYADIRNVCTEEEYNEAIQLDDKMPFAEFAGDLQNGQYIKQFRTTLAEADAKNFFNSVVHTYFPSFRFERPGYLTEPYQITLDFANETTMTGHLKNPVEVRTSFRNFASWAMDIVLDSQHYADAMAPKRLIDDLISRALVSKGYGSLRYGIGPRGFGSTRLQIIRSETNQTVYTNIFNLSSGEQAVISMFGEILRQGDRCLPNFQLEQITGIVLIDEIENHLHIKIQKEVLPKLLDLFPNVQFILSSHSPFLSMGLAESALQRSSIIDLDGMGISKDPASNALYDEVYKMMVSENERFKELYKGLNDRIIQGNRPLIVTEGKTDHLHIVNAKERLDIENCDFEAFEPPEGEWGDSKLKQLLEQLAKVPQGRKIIGIFDRDVNSIVQEIENGEQDFKDFGNNVYAFCLPTPAGRENYRNISIEFYYPDEVLKNERDGRRLYFTNEIDYLFNKSLNRPEFRLLPSPREEAELEKKVFDESRMCELTDWISSKTQFADRVCNDQNFRAGLDFEPFRPILAKIKAIVNQ